MPKQRIDLLIEKANEIATPIGSGRNPLVGEQMQALKVIKDGAIAINRGKIVAVGDTAKIKSKLTSSEIIDATGKTVVPGFVDAHTHLIFAGSREEEFEIRLKGASYLKIHQKGGGILKTVEETRRASEDELAGTCRKTLKKMLEHGTTTIEAKSGYGLTVKDEIKILRVMKLLNHLQPIEIVPTFLGAHAVPLEYENQPEEYVNLIADEMIPKVTGLALAEFCDVFCEKGVFSINQSQRILEEGKRNGLIPKLHADELSSFGGAELAAELGAVSAEHLLYTSASGLKMMAKRHVIGVLLPAAAFALMMGKYAEARKMIKAGVPIALGTDFNPSCWNENQQFVIALACRQMKMTPAEALTAATINAACAINRVDEVGSLEPGKSADVLILDIPNYSFLGYQFGTNFVEKVIKKGTLAFERR